MQQQDSNAEPVRALEQEINDLSAKAKKLDEDIQDSAEAQRKAQKDLNDSREVLKAAESRNSEFNSEIKMLQSFFAEEEGRSFSPVLDSVTTEAGFEKALSRALAKKEKRSSFPILRDAP